MGGASTLLLGVITFTPLIYLYLDGALKIPVNLQPLVVVGVQWGILLPLLTVLQSMYRGVLMARKTTGAIYSSMFVSFALTAVTMWLALVMGIEGVVAGVLSLFAGYIGEIGMLAWAARPRKAKIVLVPAAAGD
jgi:hypothetical protein